MTTELDVLKIVSERLEGAGIPFMLTGSFAMAFYATPRMTRDLDIVVQLVETDITRVTKLFAADFYIDAEDVRAAVMSRRMFNLMHSESGMKIDLIVRKDDDYRQVEFARRRQVRLDDVATWIVSVEDLILSKLLWSIESGSELQRRDIAALAKGSLDRAYLTQWSVALGISQELEQVIS